MGGRVSRTVKILLCSGERSRSAGEFVEKERVCFPWGGMPLWMSVSGWEDSRSEGADLQVCSIREEDRG